MLAIEINCNPPYNHFQDHHDITGKDTKNSTQDKTTNIANRTLISVSQNVLLKQQSASLYTIYMAYDLSVL